MRNSFDPEKKASTRYKQCKQPSSRGPRRCGQAIVLFLVPFIIFTNSVLDTFCSVSIRDSVHLVFRFVIHTALSTMLIRSIGLATALLALSNSFANAHGSHASEQNPSSDWATRHMQEEHHIDSFDAGSFFTLHDYDSSGAWTPDEVRKTYGMDDESNSGVTEERKQQALREVFALFDTGSSGVITRDNWMRLISAGKRLPDLGFGPGHHGDIEYEYEIHHFERFHGEDAKLEDLTHPEDIEHFRRHDEEEDATDRLEQLERMAIVEANIPQKFLRRS